MAEILLKLSNEIDAAIPQLMMVAFARKVGATLGRAVLALVSCSAAWDSKAGVSLRLCYVTVERRIARAWALCYACLVAYVVYDTASSAPDFVNCREHQAPRPVGIFCATALVCFVFSTKLSTAAVSCVVLLCAKERSALTGVASAVNFALWADVPATSLTVLAASGLAGAHFVFCRVRSSAALCCVGLVLSAFWAWQGVVGVLLSGVSGSKGKRV